MPIGTTNAGSTLTQVNSELQVTHTEMCGDEFNPSERKWGSRDNRIGIVLDEQPGENILLDTSKPFVFPTVTAFTETQTTQPSADPCGFRPSAATLSTLDDVLSGSIAPASVWDDPDPPHERDNTTASRDQNVIDWLERL